METSFQFDHQYREQLEERIYREGVLLKDRGHVVVGVYCSFTPKELILAAGAVPVSLCAGTQEPIPEAEVHLPANLCPLVKSSYGYGLTGTCRYFAETDFIVADATCDGKKKMFELLDEIRPVYLLHIPQSGEGPDQVDFFHQQLVRLKEHLERQTGRRLSDEAIKEQIRRKNRYRQALLNIYQLNTTGPAIMTGVELDNITFTDGFEWDIEKRVEDLEAAFKVLAARRENKAVSAELDQRPRLLLTGCPTVNKKVLHLAEKFGGLVTAMENCGGLKTIGPPVDEGKDPLRALAERYVAIACPCMTPNQKRMELITRLTGDYGVDGVIDLTWQACQLYDVESFQVKNHVSRNLDLPYLHIRTDYSESDQGQIGVRLEAFLEMITS